jgi:hypothetical protein
VCATTVRKTETTISLYVSVIDAFGVLGTLTAPLVGRGLAGFLFNAVRALLAVFGLAIPIYLQYGIDLVIRSALHLVLALYLCYDIRITRIPSMTFSPFSGDGLIMVIYIAVWLVAYLCVIANGGCAALPLITITLIEALIVVYFVIIAYETIYRSTQICHIKVVNVIESVATRVVRLWKREEQYVLRIPLLIAAVACLISFATQIFVSVVVPLIGTTACDGMLPVVNCQWQQYRMVVSIVIMAICHLIWMLKFAL